MLGVVQVTAIIKKYDRGEPEDLMQWVDLHQTRAHVMTLAGQLGLGLEHLDHAIGVTIAVHGVESINVAILLMKMANSVLQVGQYLDAVYFYEEAIQVCVC